MPEVDWNRQQWDGDYDWSKNGEEWSKGWGGSVPQWFGTVYPRLQRFLPSAAVLEIAPGFGRWTQFLLGRTQRYLGIDLSERCVAACKARFRTEGHARFIQNDGVSLAAAPDGAFGLVFSFDSLVHVEIDIMEAYVSQILRKLTPFGAAFLHHSNMAALPKDAVNNHDRATSVSGQVMAGAIRRFGGKVLVQEEVNWGDDILNDCFTLFARGDYWSDVAEKQILNPRFMEEAAIIRDCHAPYSTFDA